MNEAYMVVEEGPAGRGVIAVFRREEEAQAFVDGFQHNERPLRMVKHGFFYRDLRRGDRPFAVRIGPDGDVIQVNDKPALDDIMMDLAKPHRFAADRSWVDLFVWAQNEAGAGAVAKDWIGYPPFYAWRHRLEESRG